MKPVFARDQLRAFIDLVRSPESRIEYVLRRIDKCFGISPWAANRGLWLASQVLGCGPHRVKFAIHCAKVNDDRSRLYAITDEFDESRFGHIYFAFAPGTGLTKIGFSRNVPKRLHDLSNMAGQRLELVHATPGFMLGEHAVHCDLRGYRRVGEWFDLRSIWPATETLQ